MALVGYKNIKTQKVAKVSGNKVSINWGETTESVAFYAGTCTMASGTHSVTVTGRMINSNSYVVVSPVTSGLAMISGAAGSTIPAWSITKTNPTKSATDPKKYTSNGSFTIWVNKDQTQAIVWDYIVSNAMIY